MKTFFTSDTPCNHFTVICKLSPLKTSPHNFRQVKDEKQQKLVLDMIQTLSESLVNIYFELFVRLPCQALLENGLLLSSTQLIVPNQKFILKIVKILVCIHKGIFLEREICNISRRGDFAPERDILCQYIEGLPEVYW